MMVSINDQHLMALEKDKERLDKLEARADYLAKNTDETWNCWSEEEGDFPKRQTVRDAIDAIP